MRFTVSYNAASGPSAWNCHFVAERWDEAEGWGYGSSDFWLGRVIEGRPRVLFASAARLSGVWQSPSGSVFVAESNVWESKVHWSNASGAFRAERVGFELAGVSGLEDSCVIAWGDDQARRPAMLRFDGTTWTPIPSPGPVRAVRALDGELFAVGDRGLVARWKGDAWERWAGRERDTLSSVARSPSGEIYAGGSDGIGRSSPTEWKTLVEPDFDVKGLTFFRSELWVAARKEGLLRLTADGLTRVPGVEEPIGLDGGQRLLVVSASTLADSADGVNFRSVPSSLFQELVSDEPPLFR